MRYTTKKCPNCKYVIQRHKPNLGTKYGCPIKTCPCCGKNYIDDDYEEYAAIIEKDNIRQSIEKSHRRSIPLMALFYIGCGGVIISILNIDNFLVFFLIIVVGIAVSAYQNTPSESEIEREVERKSAIWEESNARLRNRQYAEFLDKRGFTVPLRYLSIDEGDNNKQEDLSSQKSSIIEEPQLNQSQKQSDNEASIKKLPNEAKQRPIVFYTGLPSYQEQIEKTEGFCEKCGAPVNPDSVFCRKCGTRIKEE